MMDASTKNSELADINVRQIHRNPENPRLVFRTGDLDELLESIRKYGIQVPISVYKDGSKFVLIDGERRWRCAHKLGLSKVPALVQSKPAPLENLLLMFNIHALREQWDLMTIALKLPKVISLLEREIRKAPNEREISEHTGLGRAVIRRCRLLIDLPEHYKDDILVELRKPKADQRLTEDFFIEMERSLKTVERAAPDIIPDKEVVREVLIRKFKSGVIKNRVNFRMLAKMARVENVGGDLKKAKQALSSVFKDNSVGIEEAYRKSAAQYYDEREFVRAIDSATELLEDVVLDELDQDSKKAVKRLWHELKRIYS